MSAVESLLAQYPEPIRDPFADYDRRETTDHTHR